MAKVGRPKNIKTPAILWEYFLEYKEDIKSNPINLVEQRKGGLKVDLKFNVKSDKDLGNVKETIEAISDATIKLPAERPLTFEGFQNWLEDKNIITDVTDYFENKENRYNEFLRICSRIKRNIRQDQIEGGMAGIYNPSITQRLNSLTEKTEVTASVGITPFFGDNPLDSNE